MQFGQHQRYTASHGRKVSVYQIISLLSYPQIIAIIMDNASNNMLMMPLEWRCQEQGILFSAQDACMPHTVHLAAIKVLMLLVPDVYDLSPSLLIVQLLEGIGAISNAEGKKAAACSGNYQDNVTTPLAHEHDDDATANNEIDEEAEDMDLDTNVEAANSVLPAIERV